MARFKLNAATLGTAAQLLAAARDMWNPLSAPPRITRYTHHDISLSTLCDHWRASTLANMRHHIPHASHGRAITPAGRDILV